MPTAQQITDNLTFLDGTFGQIGWKINGKAVGDSWGSIVVLANSNPSKAASFSVPVGTYKLVSDGTTAGTKTLKTVKVTGRGTGKVSVPALSLLIMWK